MFQILDRVVGLLKRFEGCVLKAYRDIVGVWTIGYGETKDVVPGMEWTQDKADAQLRSRALYFTLSVMSACPQLHKEPTDRVAACVSLAYNIGIGAFSRSSVCRKTSRREYQSAAASFALWNKAGGRVVKNLTWRRGVESKIYLGKY